MLSLARAAEYVGGGVPFSVDKTLPARPRGLRELLTLLEEEQEPIAAFVRKRGEKRWFEVANAQGIEYAFGDTWFLTGEREIFRLRITGADVFAPQQIEVVQRASLGDLASTVEPREVMKPRAAANAPAGSLEMDYNHFGDATYGGGLLFVPATGNASWYPILLALTPELRVVGYGVLKEASDAWCALNPWNGRLYLAHAMDAGRLMAYDVSAFYLRLVAASRWGAVIDMPKASEDIRLRGADGTETRIDRIQGAAFSQKTGRLYTAQWRSQRHQVAEFHTVEFHNYLRIYSAFTGKRLYGSKEYDFAGIGDEIEGLTVHPTGVIYVAVCINDLVSTDDCVIEIFAHQERKPL